LGKHLLSENDLLTDQRGSPAYISPDVLSGKPYLGKPSDCWALGVVLFTQLFGQFPFYDSVPQELFRKIKSAEYSIPKDSRVSANTISIIDKLLVLNPRLRMTAEQVLDALQTSLSLWLSTKHMISQLQVVPDIDQQLSSNNDSNKQEVTASNTQSKEQLEKDDNSLIHNTPTISHLIPGTANIPVVDQSIPLYQKQSHSMEPIQINSGRIRTTPIGTLPIRRIDGDSRPLTQSQMQFFNSFVSKRQGSQS